MSSINEALREEYLSIIHGQDAELREFRRIVRDLTSQVKLGAEINSKQAIQLNNIQPDRNTPELELRLNNALIELEAAKAKIQLLESTVGGM